MPAGSATPATNVTRTTRAIVAAYRGDPDGLARNLPPGVALHPNNTVHLSMYRITDRFNTTHVDLYTVTYLAIEIAGHDSQVTSAQDGAAMLPGRYFARYWVNNLDMVFLKRESRGVPARLGTTAWEERGGRLTSTLEVDGQPAICLEADVEEGIVDQVWGHLNYYGRRQIRRVDGPLCEIDELIELPIPVLFDLHKAESSSASIRFPEGDHPAGELASLRPSAIDSVVYCDYTIPHYPTGYVIRDYMAEGDGTG
jgi:acetoacetate decarboxylase